MISMMYFIAISYLKSYTEACYKGTALYLLCIFQIFYQQHFPSAKYCCLVAIQKLAYNYLCMMHR